MPFAFGRVDAIAGLGSEMYFMLVPAPLRRPCGGHSRSCLCKLCQQDAAAKAAFRRRSDRVSMSAVKSARYSIKITENWPKGLCRPSVYRRTMWRFQVAAIAQLKLAAVLMRMEHVFDFHSRFLGSRSRDGFGVGGPHRMPLRPPLASGRTLPQDQHFRSGRQSRDESRREGPLRTVFGVLFLVIFLVPHGARKVASLTQPEAARDDSAQDLAGAPAERKRGGVQRGVGQHRGEIRRR
jgi:hypothetical protein